MTSDKNLDIYHEKPISPKLHGIIDYGLAAMLAAAPILFGLKGPAKKLAYAEAANARSFNGLSDTPVAFHHVFSFNPAHKVTDIANLVGFAVLIIITGAAKQPAARRFFAGILLAGILNVLLTDYNGDTEA